MQIAVVASGSRGDVQPYIALGVGLKRAGHSVRLVTHENFGDLVTAHGLDFIPVEGNISEIASGAAMADLLEKGNFLKILRQMAKEAEIGGRYLAEGALAACGGADLLVAGMGGLYTGLAVAEKLDLPFLQAYVVPFTPTGRFSSVLLPGAVPALGGAFNRLTHHMTRQAIWQSFRTADTLSRRDVLSLPPAPLAGPYNNARLRHLPVLYGFSPSVIPKPADWGTDVHITGYWFLDSADDWQPPPEVTAFLDAGAAPLYIGFGSISNRNPEATAELVLEALDRTGQRAVLLSGWGGMRRENLPDSVLMVDSIPHAWLFPRTAGVVHHGGAGTTAAGLRAGVPSVVIPFFGDQPYWGRKVFELGVGTVPIPRRKLTAGRLAAAVEQVVSDLPMRERAAELGAKIRDEDGLAEAAAIITSLEAKLKAG